MKGCLGGTPPSNIGGCVAVSGLLFPSQAIWSRCFPAYAEVRRLLAEEAVGEVKLVKAYFGSPQLHIPRSVRKELGGGALLDIGVYCLQFVLMVFDGERPASIQATGALLDSGGIHHRCRKQSQIIKHREWTGAYKPASKTAAMIINQKRWGGTFFSFLQTVQSKHLRRELFTLKIPDLS